MEKWRPVTLRESRSNNRVTYKIYLFFLDEEIAGNIGTWFSTVVPNYNRRLRGNQSRETRRETQKREDKESDSFFLVPCVSRFIIPSFLVPVFRTVVTIGLESGRPFFSFLFLSLSLSILIVARTNSCLFFVPSFELKINHFRRESLIYRFYIYSEKNFIISRILTWLLIWRKHIQLVIPSIYFIDLFLSQYRSLNCLVN